MNAEALAQLDRIKRYSLSLRRLFLFLFFVTLLACVITLISLGSMLTVDSAADGADTLRRTVELDGGLAFEWNTAPLSVRVLALAYFAAVFGAALLLLHHLAKLFGLYAGGKIFTGDNVREIRLSGVMLMLISLSWVIALPIPILLDPGMMTTATEATSGWRISAPGLTLSPFFTGLIVIFISWVMDVGRRLREENDLVV